MSFDAGVFQRVSALLPATGRASRAQVDEALTAVCRDAGVPEADRSFYHDAILGDGHANDFDVARLRSALGLHALLATLLPKSYDLATARRLVHGIGSVVNLPDPPSFDFGGRTFHGIGLIGPHEPISFGDLDDVAAGFSDRPILIKTMAHPHE